MKYFLYTILGIVCFFIFSFLSINLGAFLGPGINDSGIIAASINILSTIVIICTIIIVTAINKK